MYNKQLAWRVGGFDVEGRKARGKRGTPVLELYMEGEERERTNRKTEQLHDTTCGGPTNSEQQR